MWQAQDIEELENEVEDLESLAKELKLGSSLDLDQRPPPPRTKGGKRKKKQAKVNTKSKGGGGGGGAVTLCQLMNICDSLPLGELEYVVRDRVGNLSSRYGARNPFQEPSLELSSQAT